METAVEMVMEMTVTAQSSDKEKRKYVLCFNFTLITTVWGVNVPFRYTFQIIWMKYNFRALRNQMKTLLFSFSLI